MSYDPEARRDTPLALMLKARIRREGPITVAEYMRACLHDPDLGYYTRMPAIGAGGDFVTAPEISQVFGELIGLWCAVVWRQMGSPEVVHLVELGPGRGTMMRDALRAAKVMPGFLQAVRLHLVESNAHLREVQKATLAELQADWHDALTDLQRGPAIILGNEFLDTLDVHQFQFEAGALYHRCVGLDERDRLVFVRGTAVGPYDPAFRDHGIGDGDLVESQDFSPLLALRPLLAAGPAAGLLIDYGHTATAPGETLQAIRHHGPEHPLTSPGEADLTVQIDFSQVAAYLDAAGAAIDGPVTQAEFLGSLGIVERASRLMSANPAKAAGIEAGAARLIAPNAMGSRFKAIGVRSKHLPPLPGFPIRTET